MKAMANIYLRNDQIVVAPCAGGGGLSYEIEPVHVLEADPSQLQEAALSALDTSRKMIGKPTPNLRGYKSPVLAKLRIRSLSQFYVDLALCAIYLDESLVLWAQELEPAKDGRGFQIFEAPTKIPTESLGEFILALLRRSKRINPK